MLHWEETNTDIIFPICCYHCVWWRWWRWAHLVTRMLGGDGDLPRLPHTTSTTAAAPLHIFTKSWWLVPPPDRGWSWVKVGTPSSQHGRRNPPRECDGVAAGILNFDIDEYAIFREGSFLIKLSPCRTFKYKQFGDN